MLETPSGTQPGTPVYRHSDQHRRTIIAILFVVPFAVLVAEYALIATGVGEPYPAIMMPGFRGPQMKADGTISFQVVEPEVRFEATSAVERPSIATLLDPLPSGMLMPTSTQFFRSYPRASRPPLLRAGLKDWLVDHTVPLRGRRARQLMAGNPPAPETVQWLRQRIARLYPDRSAQSVTFEWYRDAYRFQQGTLERLDRNHLDTYRIVITQ